MAHEKTTFGAVANGAEFTVKATSGEIMRLRKIDPIPASNLPGYRPRFFIPGQHANPSTYNVMGQEHDKRWRYFYLSPDCPVEKVERTPSLH